MEQKIDALTSTRGFAALMVVIFHFGTEVFPFNLAEQFFTGGNLGVSYFFVLSGFVMYWTYHKRVISYGEFLKRRIARIVPLYLFAILLSLLFLIIFQGRPGDNFVTALLLNLTFLQAYVPGYAATINSPGWTLSVEMLFYLLFPLLLLFCMRYTKAFIWFAFGFYAFSQLAHLFLLQTLHPEVSNKVHDFIYYNPVWHLNGFIIGITGGYLYQRVHERGIKLSSLVFASLIIAVITWRPVSLHNGMLAPLFIVFIVAVASRQPAFLKWQPLVFLGEISYGIYLLQEPVYKFMMQMNQDHLQWEYPGLFYTYLGVLLIVATVSYHYIETPLRRKINSIKN